MGVAMGGSGRVMRKGKGRGAVPAKAVAGIGNVEMVGDKVKVYSLQHLLHNKRDFKRREASKLGEVIGPWFEKEVARPGKQLAGVWELWVAEVPAAIVAESRLAGMLRGTLSVQVSSAPVRAELDSLLRRGLLRRLQELSRGVIYRVKTLVDGRDGGQG